LFFEILKKFINGIFLFLTSLEIKLFSVKLIIKLGNFLEKKKFIKNHFKILKLEIKPFFQKEKIQLF
jgi:hypothetical protein